MQDSSIYSHIQSQFPEQEQLKCPRCDSPNTKFCYYNNYNLSQPRHFCKSCKRYWTKGGALRNIPVGGGSRKTTKRSSAATSAAASKRPAASVSAAKDKKNSENSNNSGENFGGELENLSFSSLLGSNGDQFTSLLDGLSPNGPGLEVDDPGLGPNVDPGLDTGSGGHGDGGFLSMHGGGAGGDWGGGDGGDDLAIYTPSSNFQ